MEYDLDTWRRDWLGGDNSINAPLTWKGNLNSWNADEDEWGFAY